MSKDLDNLRASLQLKTDINAARDKLCDAAMETLKRMPSHRIASCLQYLEKNLMPAVERKGGTNAPDLAVFKETANLLKWALLLYDRLEMQTRVNTHLQLDLTILRERLLLAESELMKYQTMEDLLLTDSYKHIEKGVRARIESDFKGKKS
jgi:hypothetical protein